MGGSLRTNFNISVVTSSTVHISIKELTTHMTQMVKTICVNVVMMWRIQALFARGGQVCIYNEGYFDHLL
jgi:hypothetical protein